MASAGFNDADQTGELKLWDVSSGKERSSFQGIAGGVHSIAVAPDGKILASAGRDGLRLWDVATGKGLGGLEGHTLAVQSVVFAPDGKSLASGGSDGRVIVWEAASGRKLREWQLPGFVYGVAFAPDGRHLATANANGTVYVHRLAPPADPGEQR